EKAEAFASVGAGFLPLNTFLYRLFRPGRIPTKLCVFSDNGTNVSFRLQESWHDRALVDPAAVGHRVPGLDLCLRALHAGTFLGLPLDVHRLQDAQTPDDLFGVLRSEEHTSELQSRFDLVCRLLLEKKNTT